MLRGVGGVDVGGAGVGPHTKQGKPSGGPELRVERELVVQLGDAVGIGAAARQVDVIAACLQAGAHHFDVGDGQGRVQDDGTAGFTDGAGNCGAIAGIENDSRDPRIVEPVRQEGGAGGHRVGDDEFLEHRLLHEFEGGHGPHRAGTQHQGFHKLLFSGEAGLGLEAVPPRPPRI